ncbi:MAG TPA: hypothetical protein VOA41_20785 [Candidatus Dormibacteraeota bacterium]|nr:hypothetical protein [Candidatus Dormibacteraeota bacterium]
MRTSDPGAQGSSIATRLLAVTNELRELEQLIQVADLDSRVLRDFRGAVDNVRTTAWATQQWIERRERGSDPYGVLPGLSAERVRRTTELAKDLVLDLQSVEVSIETEGLRGLFEAIDGLHGHLAHLFKN